MRDRVALIEMDERMLAASQFCLADEVVFGIVDQYPPCFGIVVSDDYRLAYVVHQGDVPVEQLVEYDAIATD